MGLRVNVGKTKVIKCHLAANAQVESAKYPCGICGKGRNSIQCGECKKWVHKQCSGLKGNLKKDPGYRCAKCLRGGWALGGAEEQEVVLEDGSSLECVNRCATRVPCWEQHGAVERRQGLESEGLGDSAKSLQSC